MVSEPKILTPKRYDEHPRPFIWEIPWDIPGIVFITLINFQLTTYNRGQNCWSALIPPPPRVQCWDIEFSVRWGDPTLCGGGGGIIPSSYMLSSVWEWSTEFVVSFVRDSWLRESLPTNFDQDCSVSPHTPTQLHQVCSRACYVPVMEFPTSSVRWALGNLGWDMEQCPWSVPSSFDTGKVDISHPTGVNLPTSDMN